jgi:PKD repeat protein/plastocyanin
VRRLASTALALTLLALLLPASALADAGITITTSGFDKQQVVIKPGENVVFTNNTLLTDSVQFDDEASARCTTNPDIDGSCTRNFPTAGQFKFYDPQHSGCTSYDTCVDPFRGIVIVDGPPTVTGLTGPPTATRGDQVTFTGSGADPNGDGIQSFNWDFGDGQGYSTTTDTVQHTDPTAGHYTVTLTVTDTRNNVSAPQQVGIDITVPDSDGDGFDDDHDACSLVPGVAPNGCPAVPVIIQPPLVAETTTAKALGQTGAVKSGVTIVLECSDTCTATLTLLPVGSLARKSAAAPLSNTQTVTISGGGSQLVTLKFTRAAQKALAKATNPRVKLVVVITDALGRVQTRTSVIQLKPVKKFGKLPAIGISDQKAETFTDPLFQVLKLKYARLVTPWNAIYKESARLDQWLQEARAHGVRPLVSFEHARSDLCPKKPCRAPTVSQYKKMWKAFHKKYPWVRDVSPWDEVNSSTQPTGKRPDLAAAFYNVVRASCRGCSIVAADVLDLNNMRRYLQAFLLKAKGKPRLWGIHNYRDTNRFRQTGTRQLLATVKGTVWFTETGGIVSFTTQGGKKALPKSELRAKRAMDYMFRLAEIDDKRVKRIYVYQWKVNFAGDRFDAGVVRPDGTPRPSFDVLTLNASIARKR